MILSYKGHCGAINDFLGYGFKSLVLAHVLHHAVAAPFWIIYDDGPVVVVCVATTDI